MKKLLTAISVLLIVSISGCITDSGNDTAKDIRGGGTLRAEEYLTLSDGVVWMWDSVTTDTSGNQLQTDTTTSTITGTTVLDSETYWVVQEDDEAVYMRLDDNIVYLYREETTMKPSVSKHHLADNHLPYYNFNMYPGGTWTILSDTQAFEEYTSSITMTGRFFGTETIKTPAGTFNNCAKFQVTTNSTDTPNSGDMSNRVKYNQTVTTWLAPSGIGPIKFISTMQEYAGDALIVETITTDESIYYTIPGGPSGGTIPEVIDGDEPTGFAGTHTYYPFALDATWTYLMTEKYSDEEETTFSEYTHTITGTKIIEGEEYWVSVDEFDMSASYERIEDDILYNYSGVIEKIGKIAVKSPAAARVFKTMKAAQDEPYESELAIFKLSVEPGTSWNIYTYTFTEEDGTLVMEMNGAYLGIEDISLDIGAFTGAKKYLLTIAVQYSDSDYSFNDSYEVTIWLAPDVGFVLSTETVDFEETYDDEVYSYTLEVTEELISYSIP